MKANFPGLHKRAYDFFVKIGFQSAQFGLILSFWWDIFLLTLAIRHLEVEANVNCSLGGKERLSRGASMK